MIKLIFCLRRLPHMTQEEFQAYWHGTHAALVRQHAPTLHIRRYEQSHTFFDTRIAAPVDARGIAVPPYDGVAELYWDSIEDVVAAGATKEGRAAGRALIEDERRFIDLSASPLFWSRVFSILD